MRKKELALAVIERLKKEYPDSDCTLDYNEAWKLLISVRLAAQCTDARVNMIVPKLYEKFPDVNALADAPVEEIEEIVRPCGLGKSKAGKILQAYCIQFLILQHINPHLCKGLHDIHSKHLNQSVTKQNHDLFQSQVL